MSFWTRTPPLKAYANRTLRPVEVVMMVRYLEELSGSVLEAGCGGGRVIGYLTATSSEAHGIDVSEVMLEYCRGAFPKGTFALGDVRRVDSLEGCPFDAVLATCNLLDALDEADRHLTLDALHRAIVPGGLLIMSAHNRAYVPSLVGPVGQARIYLRSRNLRRLAGTLSRFPRQVANRRRLRGFEVDTPGFAILNDAAHDYSLLQYYIWREDQERQLADHGFEVLECLDLDGKTLAPGEQAEQFTELHYVARRSA